MTKTEAMVFVVDGGADDAPMGSRHCHCSIPLGPEFSRTRQRQAERGQRNPFIQLSLAAAALTRAHKSAFAG
jgi:hypothetical protein